MLFLLFIWVTQSILNILNNRKYYLQIIVWNWKKKLFGQVTVPTDDDNLRVLYKTDCVGVGHDSSLFSTSWLMGWWRGWLEFIEIIVLWRCLDGHLKTLITYYKTVSAIGLICKYVRKIWFVTKNGVFVVRPTILF